MKGFRKESDLLGDLDIPEDVYYGVQTQRAINNFKISGQLLSSYHEFITALGYVKKGAAKTNFELGLLPENLYSIISETCDDIIAGKYHDQFPIDMI